MNFEILVDKAFVIEKGFLGILITLYRRADRFVDAQIENLHNYVIGEQHKLFDKINEMTEKEQLLDHDVHKMIEEQHEPLSEIHQMHEEQMRTRDRDGDTYKGK
jgi:Fic family protein